MRVFGTAGPNTFFPGITLNFIEVVPGSGSGRIQSNESSIRIRIAHLDVCRLIFRGTIYAPLYCRDTCVMFTESTLTFVSVQNSLGNSEKTGKEDLRKTLGD